MEKKALTERTEWLGKADKKEKYVRMTMQPGTAHANYST